MSSGTLGSARAVIFDLDGTLIDSAKGIAAALDMLRTERGMTAVALDDVRAWVSLGAEDLIINALGSSPTALAADLAAFRAAYAQVPPDPADFYPRAFETLEALRAGGSRLGVCTNKPQGLAANIIQGLGLAPLVEVVVGGAPGLRPKPDPTSLQQVMDRLGAGPGTAIYVGDSEVDAETAEAAGVPFVLVGHGYAIGARAAIKCAALIENLDDLLQLTDSLASPFPAWRRPTT